MQIKKRIIISGPNVHNVGYRVFLMEEAEALLIPYFSARNLRDQLQQVEVLVGGEKEKVNSFVEFIRNNFPETAEVSSIEVEDYTGEIRTIESFSRSFSASQLSKIATTGVLMLETQREMKGDIKEMKGDIKEMKGDIKEMKEDIKEVLCKQDELVGITRGGFEMVAVELKSFKELYREVADMRREINELKAVVSRIERTVEAR